MKSHNEKFNKEKLRKGKQSLGVSIFIFILLSILFTLPTVHAADAKRLIMATTTSTESSGLLSVLLPPFEKKFGVRVDVIAVGTGQALALGQNGDADIVFVHAREAEDKFVKDGYGVNRRDVMYNDFVIVGPKNDPAEIKGLKDVTSAFSKISTSKSYFISRGDESGTHIKELAIWEKAKVQPKGSWYLSVGQGMGASLNIANEKNGYILTDRGTFLAYQGKLELEVLVAGDPVLYNPYGIIAVNPKVHPHVNYDVAMKFIEYVTSPEGQRIIAGYKIHGGQLFFPLVIQEKK